MTEQPTPKKPFLAAAFLCEKVLEQKDDVLTTIRIIDTFYVTIPPNLPPDARPTIPITGLLAFKKATPGTGGEKHQVRMRLRVPSGTIRPAWSQEITFKPDELAGFNMILNLTLGVEEYGIFWLEVSVDDDEVMTQIPFRLLKAPTPLVTIH